MAIFERIVTVYNDKGSKQALKDLNKLEKNFADAGKKIAKSIGLATLATGALAVKLGKDAVQGAMEDQKAQISLATALRNTVGATDAQIASTVTYLDALELQVGINNNELIPSLQKLTQATGDIEQAQALQALALDVSAGTGKSLIAVTDGIVRAIGGNIGALKRLGIPLDEAIVKNKDLNGALSVLSTTFGGQALNRAETFEFQIERLRLQFDQTLDTLGYALIPVLQELAEVFRADVLPVFEQFIADNKDQIADTLRDVAQFSINAAKGLASMFKTISDNLTTFKAFGALLVGIFVGNAVYNGVKALIGIITLLTGAFTKQAVAGTAAGTATAFATGGASAIAAAAGIAAFTTAAGLAFIAMNKMTEGLNENTVALEKQTGVVASHLKDLDRLAKLTANANLKNLKNVQITTNLNKKTAEQIKLEKALAALKKLGVAPTNEKDPIQLEAARLNLLKQSNLEEAARVNALIANMEAQMKLNEAAQRYTDLLQVLSDAVISDEEVSVLAQKWNITKGEVLEYIARIYAANSTDLNDGPIVNLLMKWGLTKEEAEKYVDFTRALKDEKIDDSEIEKLMGKWGMTRAEVLAYGKTVQDGTALQAALSKGWAYPGDEAADAWKRALAALNAYLAALNTGKPQGIPSGTPTGTSTGTPTGTPSAVPNAVIPNPFNPSSAPVSTGAVKEQIDTLTALRESTESGTAISFLLKEQIDTLSDSISTLGLGALSDERARMQAMGTFDSSTSSGFDPASFRMADNAGMTINMTVQGNVQTEQDLADAIRQRILLEQASGKPILFVGGL
jgi:hypothetical protein